MPAATAPADHPEPGHGWDDYTDDMLRDLAAKANDTAVYTAANLELIDRAIRSSQS